MTQYRTYLWLMLATTVGVLFLRVTSGAVVPGHVEVWGRNLFGEATPPPGLEGVIAVAGGSTHSLALRTNGTVVAWGSHDNGESTVSVPAGLSNVISIAANAFSAAVKVDGTVVIWGSSLPGVTNVPPEAVGIARVEIIGSAVVALRTNGTVVAWGHGSETNVPAGLSNVIQIAGVGGHVLALTSNRTIIGWGSDFWGQATHPSGLTNVVRIGAGQEVSMAVKEDGTVFRWGTPFGLPGDAPGVTDVIDLDIGYQHALALRRDGTVRAWGENLGGESTVPPFLNGVTAISAGGNHNLVITARPIINSITPPVSAAVGANISLTLAASGEPLRYQWQHKGTNLPAGTNASITIENISPEKTGSYGVYVSNTHGYNYATTSIALPPPTITAQPESSTVYRGATATLAVVVSGFPPFTYQWFRNGTAVLGETNATIVVPTLGREDSSTYRVTVADLAGGTVTSRDAVVTVFDPRPTSSSFVPVVDTSIFSSGVNPLGTNTILAGTRGNGIRDRGLLRFELSSIPTNAVIESAFLRLRLVRAPRGGGAESTFRLHRALKAWGGAATWANASETVAWSAAGGAEGEDFSTNGIPGAFMFGSGEFAFGSSDEMVADISEWIQNPATNHGWFFISDQEAVVGTARHFGSSESENPPRLMIRYGVPAEVPTIRDVARTTTNLVFAIDGVAGWIYSIQTREAVDSGIWTSITNAPAGAGLAPVIITIPMANSHRFFRAFRY